MKPITDALMILVQAGTLLCGLMSHMHVRRGLIIQLQELQQSHLVLIVLNSMHATNKQWLEQIQQELKTLPLIWLDVQLASSARLLLLRLIPLTRHQVCTVIVQQDLTALKLIPTVIL